MNIILVLFALLLGLAGWICHLWFILSALRKPDRGQILIDYHHFKEMYIEIIIFFAITIFELYVLVDVWW